MTKYRIVASVRSADESLATLRTSLGLARVLDAEVELVHTMPDYRGLFSAPTTSAREDFEASQRKQVEQAGPVRHKSLELAEQAGVAARWSDEFGAAHSVLFAAAIDADLIVVDRRTAGDAAAVLPHGVAGDLVAASARPIVVAPGGDAFEDCGSRVLVAWDGSKESQRAVASALPLLRRAEQVDAVYVQSSSWVTPGAQNLPAQLESYLGRHGVTAVCRSVTVEQKPIGDVILSEAKRAQSNLIVMGAYSHSRLWETVFGGTTAFLLAHATVPVFLSH